MVSSSRTLLDLTLSASSLTQVEKCARLFRYVHLDRLLWPTDAAPESALDGERGTQFHRLVELHSRGISVAPLVLTLDPKVQQWWEVFVTSPHAHPAGEVMAEVPLWIQHQGLQFVARLDRLVIDRERQRFHIVDWKTERTRPDNSKLMRSWQVRLYPLMLCLAGQILNHGSAIRPEMVRMTIWYANYPSQPFELVYSPTQFALDLQHLDSTVQTLRSLQENRYPLTTRLDTCVSCLFRSRCYGLMPDMIDPDLLESLQQDAAARPWSEDPLD